MLALCDFNSTDPRNVKDRRPKLAHLARVSDAIEQYADTIRFIHRDEYDEPQDTDRKGIAELIVAKQRNGPTCKLLLRFTGPYMRFDNLAPADYAYFEGNDG